MDMKKSSLQDLEACLQVKDWTGLAHHCEEVELDAAASGSKAAAQVYAALLAVYLLQRDLVNAKFLWKRAPQEYKEKKESSAFMPEIWSVGRCLWQKDWPEAHVQLRSLTWPPHVQPIMAELVESLRREVADIVSRSYDTISSTELAEMLGIPDAKAACDELGWTMENGFVKVKRQSATSQSTRGAISLNDLPGLTDWVSTLEN